MVVGSLLTAFVLPFTKGPPVREERTLVGGSSDDPLTPGITGVSGGTPGDGPGTTGGNNGATGGPGGNGTSAGGTTGGGSSGAGSAGGAVVGVTDKQIKIGYLLLDTG